MLLDISGAKEKQGLGNRVKCHVKKHAQDAQRPAEAECKHHDPAVVNAGIGQHAPEAPLDEDERNCYSHRKQSEKNQEMRGKLRAQAFGSQNVESHETVESAVEDSSREHRRHRDRRFTVGIRLPGMHGSDARLRSVPEQNQNEGQPHGRLVKLGGISDEDRPVQTRKRFRPQDPMSGIVGQNRAEQGHGEADAPDDGVLPCGFKRGFAPVKHDQEHRRQCGSLDGHPKHSEVVGKSDQKHGENKQRRERVVFPQFMNGKLAPAPASPGESVFCSS